MRNPPHLVFAWASCFGVPPALEAESEQESRAFFLTVEASWYGGVRAGAEYVSPCGAGIRAAAGTSLFTIAHYFIMTYEALCVLPVLRLGECTSLDLLG